MPNIGAIEQFVDPYLGVSWLSLGALARIQQRGDAVEVDVVLGSISFPSNFEMISA